MFIPNLMPGDIHRMWMNRTGAHFMDSNTVAPHNASNEANTHTGIDQNEYPSMPSYTANASGPIKHSQSTLKIRKIIGTHGASSDLGFNDVFTTLDQVSLLLDSKLKSLDEIGNIGADTMKPFGYDKTLNELRAEREQEKKQQDLQHQEESSIQDDLHEVQALAASASYDFSNDEGSITNFEEAVERVGRTTNFVPPRISISSEGPISSHDLDADLSDRDIDNDAELEAVQSSVDMHFGIDDQSSDSGYIQPQFNMQRSDGDQEHDEEDILAPADGDGEFFMASEEYQVDHTINEHSRKQSYSFLGNSSFTQPAVQESSNYEQDNDVPRLTGAADTGITGGTTATIYSAAAHEINSTAITSPLGDIEDEISDHDMTVE